MSVTVRLLTSQQLMEELTELTQLLARCASVGDFLGLPPENVMSAEAHLLSLRQDLRQERRVLLVASVAGRLAGFGQILLSTSPGATHRAVAERVCVDVLHRRLGIGRRIMVALQDAALNRGRWLMVMSVRESDPTQGFCRALGYVAAGKVPDFELDSNGQTFDHTTFYRQLGPIRRDRTATEPQKCRRS